MSETPALGVTVPLAASAQTNVGQAPSIGSPIDRPSSLRSRVSEALAAAIVSGELEPETLLTVPTLAVEFNVSATPVREAMLDLEKRGFVESVRNKGFRVTPVSEKMLGHIVDVRQRLEPSAMRDLATSGLDLDMVRFRALADEIVAGARASDLRTYLHADREFHLALTDLLGNPLLSDAIADLRARTRLTGLVSMLDSKQLDLSAGEHHLLLDAIAAGDGAAAKAIMHNHLGHVSGWWAGRDEAIAPHAHQESSPAFVPSTLSPSG
jgi:DNA-binding GntR family transcriptional regulator